MNEPRWIREFYYDWFVNNNKNLKQLWQTNSSDKDHKWLPGWIEKWWHFLDEYRNWE